jgi:hypothetical protein
MVRVARTNFELLQMLGVTMAAGRGFLPDEDRPGSHRVAIVTSDLWRPRPRG